MPCERHRPELYPVICINQEDHGKGQRAPPLLCKLSPTTLGGGAIRFRESCLSKSSVNHPFLATALAILSPFECRYLKRRSRSLPDAIEGIHKMRAKGSSATLPFLRLNQIGRPKGPEGKNRNFPSFHVQRCVVQRGSDGSDADGAY